MNKLQTELKDLTQFFEDTFNEMVKNLDSFKTESTKDFDAKLAE